MEKIGLINLVGHSNHKKIVFSALCAGCMMATLWSFDSFRVNALFSDWLLVHYKSKLRLFRLVVFLDNILNLEARYF